MEKGLPSLALKVPTLHQCPGLLRGEAWLERAEDRHREETEGKLFDQGRVFDLGGDEFSPVDFEAMPFVQHLVTDTEISMEP
ncbi:hypothetical protein TREES_T100011906 [Tupaia chinensis]|uniref:Uncharacterized protein n=1 Tax=Tupaia chinensis TaxID=246437 RepID=L9KTE7_TUPCH|nr:hypothetical protein TREES_T100011906 [Tupaia chinensis]